MENNYSLMEEVLKSVQMAEKYMLHSDWRVRYAAAVAMGEDGDEKWLPCLYRMLQEEEKLPLYSQPAVERFEGSPDDTRMAERLLPIKEVFDKDYPEELKEIWKCRGRVRHACLFAIYDIGRMTPQLLELLHTFLIRPGEDYSVCAAAARVLAKSGHSGSIPYLEQAGKIDEWCVQTESRKAIKQIRAREEK